MVRLSLQSNGRIERIGTIRAMRRACGVIDGHRVIGDDELGAGCFCRNDFAYALGPDRAVHGVNCLHLEHQLGFVEPGKLALYPVQPLGRACFLGIDVGKEVREVTAPHGRIVARKGSNSPGAGAVDRSEQTTFDLVVYDGSEKRRVKIGLIKALRRMSSALSVHGYEATVRKTFGVGRKIQVVKAIRAFGKESLLIPDRDVMAVSGCVHFMRIVGGQTGRRWRWRTPGP